MPHIVSARVGIVKAGGAAGGWTQASNQMQSHSQRTDKVVTNTVIMYGSIKGIAGTAIGTVKALELPVGE